MSNRPRENVPLPGDPAELAPVKPAPRTSAELREIVLLVPCDQCWVPRFSGCSVFKTGPSLIHFARYQRANRRGLISDEELALAKSLKGEGSYVTEEEGGKGKGGDGT